MCGIIGFTGELDAKTVLLDGLQTLEYRGYDSAGIAYYTKDGIKTVKSVGKVSCLREKINQVEKIDQAEKSPSTCGIGHTRWATHGGVTDANAHPHTCGKVTLIHNGIIENYHELENALAAKGKVPCSQTDTELVAMLMDSCYEGNPMETIKKSVAQIEGAFAFCIQFADEPEVIYCIRKQSPLVACHTESGSFVASDMVALITYSREYFVLPELHIAKLTKGRIEVSTLEGKAVSPEMIKITWDMAAAKKGGYPHFMLKEIHEQPDALHSTILPRVKEGNLPDLTADHIPLSIFKDISHVIITACGTAMHAGLVGRIMIEKLIRIPVSVEIASEFRYQDPVINEKTLVITISQSGETADTLAALRLAKEKKASVLSIVNVKGSSIARESDYVLYTHAGPEIAVASTKAYTAQLACLFLFSYQFALGRGCITEKECADKIAQLLHMIAAIEETLTLEKVLEEAGSDLAKAEDLFFIGRGMDYALSCEGSIKLKEISYIHSEAYAAGELKHGTLSLIVEGTPVVALATQEKVFAKMISNVREVKARGARVILITNGRPEVDASVFDYQIALPKLEDELVPFTAAIALQMLAYYTALHRGLEIDQPRNLAKSVTVE